MINKKGVLADTILMPAVFFIMLLIAIGMVVGVYLYLGNGYDFRLVDVSALNHKIKDCISSSNLSGNSNLFELCNIKKEAIENHKLFFKICVNLDPESCSSSESKLFQSGSNFESCFFTGAKSNGNYPLCKIAEIIKDGQNYSIISGSNQEINRVPLEIRGTK